MAFARHPGALIDTSYSMDAQVMPTDNREAVVDMSPREEKLVKAAEQLNSLQQFILMQSSLGPKTRKISRIARTLLIMMMAGISIFSYLLIVDGGSHDDDAENMFMHNTGLEKHSIFEYAQPDAAEYSHTPLEFKP